MISCINALKSKFLDWFYEKYYGIKTYRIIYYDSDKESCNYFKNRINYYNKGYYIPPGNSNIKYDVTICNTLFSIIDEVNSHSRKKIDLILLDLYSHDFSDDYILKSCSLTKYKNSSFSSSNSIMDLIADFQNHKNHINREFDRCLSKLGLSIVESLINHFELNNIDGIPIALHSLIGRRLLSTHESSFLQAHNIMWVWKPKFNLHDPHCGTIEKECNSIYSAIQAHAFKMRTVNSLKKHFWFVILAQVLLVVAVCFDLYRADFFGQISDYLSGNSIHDIFDRILEIISAVYGILTGYKLFKKIRKI